MLDTKIAQYLKDVRRDVGADVESEIQKRLAVKTDSEKEELLKIL